MIAPHQGHLFPACMDRNTRLLRAKMTPVMRQMAASLLGAASPTGVAFRCIRTCPACGKQLSTVEVQKHGIKWFQGDAHLLEHGYWHPALPSLVAAALIRVLGRDFDYGDAETDGWASAAPPPGPYTTPAKAKQVVVWTFAKRAQMQADPAVAAKLAKAAKTLQVASYAQPWDWFAAGVREAIRLQSQPATADVVHAMDALATLSGYRGWFAVPATVKPLPSQAYYNLKIAMFLSMWGQNGMNPDAERDESLKGPLLAVALQLVDAPAYQSDATDNHAAVVALCDWVHRSLPATATSTIAYVEAIRAVASRSRPRTVGEIAAKQWDITVDAAKAGAGAAAKAGTEVVQSAQKGIDDAAGPGTSTMLIVGGAVAGLVAIGAAAYAWGKK